ncbi:uncharacterized protein SAPINGB_P005517 [Magnusiomyces paraingens]|uniref:Uncharacterized protein n=1 Tax=Magnusiomyces paraingens TaxID=2606893 RepID=A0A5E8C784_9ASCO|nr:uncharacterized protein SAPINGB_P005517 [Saprochaete ingens]VVT57066.1 unnamed protein product [Saprochaete ingens]
MDGRYPDLSQMYTASPSNSRSPTKSPLLSSTQKKPFDFDFQPKSLPVTFPHHNRTPTSETSPTRGLYGTLSPTASPSRRVQLRPPRRGPLSPLSGSGGPKRLDTVTGIVTQLPSQDPPLSRHTPSPRRVSPQHTTTSPHKPSPLRSPVRSAAVSTLENQAKGILATLDTVRASPTRSISDSYVVPSHGVTLTPSRLGKKRSFSNSYSSPTPHTLSATASTPRRDTTSFSMTRAHTHDVRMDKKRRKVTFEDEMITNGHKPLDENSLAALIRETRNSMPPLSKSSSPNTRRDLPEIATETQAVIVIQQQLKEMEKLLMGKLTSLESELHNQSLRISQLENENLKLRLLLKR